LLTLSKVYGSIDDVMPQASTRVRAARLGENACSRPAFRSAEQPANAGHHCCENAI